RRPLRHGSLSDPEIRQSEAERLPRLAAVWRRPRKANLCNPAIYAGGFVGFRRSSLRAIPPRCGLRTERGHQQIYRLSYHGRSRHTHVCLLRHRLLRNTPFKRRTRACHRRGAAVTTVDSESPLLQSRRLTKRYGRRLGCRNVSFDLYEGEVMAVVGESGSGKTTLLQLLSGQLTPSAGEIRYRLRDGTVADLWSMREPRRRL